MTGSARIAAFFAAMAACVGVSACGDDDTGDPIPADKAARLEERIDAVEQAVGEQCTSLASRVQAAQVTVSSLDEDGVGADVQDALADGIDNLRDLAVRDCEGQPEEETETAPETTQTLSPPDTTPEETTTTPAPTEPTTPTPEPVPIPEDPEPDEGDGGDQFDSDGGGAGPPGQLKKDDG